jgi:hypothetical protein
MTLKELAFEKGVDYRTARRWLKARRGNPKRLFYCKKSVHERLHQTYCKNPYRVCSCSTAVPPARSATPSPGLSREIFETLQVDNWLLVI